MEISQLRTKPAYYFSWPDQEILDDNFLSLPCDEETWLYKVDARAKDQYRYFELGSPFQHHHVSTVGGTVDSRTFTRRKHCALRPSLESVVESSLSNRSSLGLLSSSKLLNDTLQCMETPHSENQERTSSNSIGSEKNSSTHRVFKLDSPFTNVAALGGSKFLATNFILERTRLNSDTSDISFPYSLENCSFVEKNGQMTDSLLNFLEKQDHEPTQVDSEFLVNSIDPVNCRPPSGFRDNEMTESVVNIHDVDGFPNCEMTNSIKDYLENVKSNTPSLLIKNIASSETENIPPINSINNDKYPNINDTITVIDDGKGVENKKLSSTYDLEKNGTYDLGKNGDMTYDLNSVRDEISNIPFTNTVNILRKNNERGGCNDDLNKTRSLNISYEKKINSVQERSEQSYKVKALNNRDLNLNEKIKSNRHIPSKNSTFNTTFTKLSPQESIVNSDVSKLKCNDFERSTEMLNCGLEDDTASSASDSSFSSSSTKPRSVDELRTIAQQQECSLVQQTSTPVESSNKSTSKLVDMDINISPIRRPTIGGYHSESRSANSSPIRNHQQPQSYQHPISKLRQPTTAGASQQMMPASSMSNIARPKLSGLRMPKSVRRFTAPQKVESRPSTAPIQTSQGIPRPQISRLPMPRFRGSGIPGPMQGHL